MSDSADISADAAPPSPDTAHHNPAPQKSAGKRLGVIWLVLVLLVVAALVYGWLRFGHLLGTESTIVDTSGPAQSIASPSPALAGELAALQRSLDDAAGVNRALREQVLGLTQRVGLLEDGFSGMERGAAPGVDAVRFAEADFLLRLGEERLRLFGDVGGARNAFDLADEQLSEISDPRATAVRQTLALERDALASVAVSDVPVLLGRLDRLAAQTASWPLKGRDRPVDSAPDEPGRSWWSRAGSAVDRYFRVRRTDPSERAGGGPLLRERLELDFSRARLLILRGQGEAAHKAIASARVDLQTNFDASDVSVAQALKVMSELLAAPLSPTLPALGESRRELARLRGVTLRGAANPAADRATDATPADIPSISSQDSAASVPNEPMAEAPSDSDDALAESDAMPAATDDDADISASAADDAVPDETDDTAQDH